ncbi:uncharacterized protein N7511_005355 [Penicillium nucicola]|uniref:uncharacterized protein n=1 Tax=Penicillium nucicola TaxID=1850975 RepID=UPI0025458314|nr:uncharacterized protein N7511_005355 [Penicillium nucicola]KAJ5761973.1 hypothetical protein N7511_005355 [Penicillium nucicola]
MKAFFGLGALAALCNSVYGLTSGTYTIESVISQGNLALTAHSSSPGIPLDFTEKHGDKSQIWDFHAITDDADNKYFTVRNLRGAYIDCGTEQGSSCVTGQRSQAFTPEFVGDGKYELVAENSGYFLRSSDDGQLLLDGYDGSDSERFFLRPAQGQ